jgi:hypothetical protein
MKYFILIILIISNCFANNSLNGNISIITGIKDELYEDDSNFFIAPLLSLKYKNYVFSGNSLGIITTNEDTLRNFSLEGSYSKYLLKSGNLDNKINENRLSPLYLSFSSTKNIKNDFISFIYKRELHTSGNIFSIDFSHLYFIKKINYLNMISKIKYTMFDENYSNYYFNFTSDEYNSMNLPYKNNSLTNRIDGGITLLYRITSTTDLSLSYQLSFLDKNYIKNLDNGSINSLFTLGTTYTF